MTPLPTAPGSVIGWHHDGVPGVAVLEHAGWWTENAWDYPHSAAQLADRLDGITWWFLGLLTPDGVVTVR